MTHTFNPCCNFAISGLSEMKRKSFRFHVNGIGTMSDTNTAISNTSSAKTWWSVRDAQEGWERGTYETIVERHAAR